jgi:hypothetical protein
MQFKDYLRFLLLLGILFSCETPEGKIGPKGLKSLIKVTNVQSGADCPNGGIKVETGIDINDNDTLDTNEVDNSVFVCNGQDDFLSYVAAISQSGTDVPQTNVIKNTLDLGISWTRVSQGKYKGILNKSIDLSKTIILTNSNQIHCKLTAANEIMLENSCGVNAYCDDFSSFFVEIKVFN